MGDGEFRPLTESKPMSRLQQNSAQLITSARGPPKPNLVQIHALGASGHMDQII